MTWTHEETRAPRSVWREEALQKQAKAGIPPLVEHPEWLEMREVLAGILQEYPGAIEPLRRHLDLLNAREAEEARRGALPG